MIFSNAGMAFTPDDIRANRDHFPHKLHAETQRGDTTGTPPRKQFRG